MGRDMEGLWVHSTGSVVGIWRGYGVHSTGSIVGIWRGYGSTLQAV